MNEEANINFYNVFIEFYRFCVTDYNTLNEAVTTGGWPKLNSALGKVIFVLHPGKYTVTYVNMDSTFRKMAMFPAASDTDTDNTYAAFVIHNDPIVDSIHSLVSQNYIVRTRINSSLVFNESQYQAALESGAQILSSDFTKGRNDRDDLPYVFFDKQFYIRKNPFLAP